MKTWGPLFKKYFKFHNGDNRALNQAWSPSERGLATLATPQANSHTICP